MLMDELKEFYDDHSKQLFWLGADVRFGQLEDEWNGTEAMNDLLALLGTATLYDCAPLAGTLYAQWGEKPFRLVRDCFGPLPPYPITAMELKVRGSRAIVLIEAVKVTETPVVMCYSLREEALKRPGRQKPYHAHSAGVGGVTPLIEAAWQVQFSVLISLEKSGYLFSDSLCAYFCDGRGRLLTAPIANERINALLNSQSDSPRLKLINDVLEYTAVHISTAAMVMNLMACKNVGSEPRPVPEKMQRARRRRGKTPLTEYRVLNVTLPGARRRTDGAAVTANAGEPLALQVIPGQYRDYTEKGLFGKYKGVFWVPAHTRGSAEVGEVKGKTYKARPGNPAALQTREGECV